MHAVFLDADTLGDTDLSSIAALFDSFKIYPLTSAKQRLEHCQNADVILTNKVVIDRQLIEQLPQLKAIQLSATGMNNIDLAAAADHQISVFNVAGYSTFPVAQLTLQFMLNFATRALEHDKLVKQGAWQASRMFTLTDFASVELSGKNLLLIGHGAIGQKVAQLAQAFEMNVSIAQLANRPQRAGQTNLQQALPKADFVSLHCPLSPETENLVDRQFLSQMKSSAYIINTARGPIINEADLAQALINQQIAGAGLDVLCQEPPPADNPLLQASVPNTIITPHIAWASDEAKIRLVAGMKKSLQSFINAQNQ